MCVSRFRWSAASGSLKGGALANCRHNCAGFGIRSDRAAGHPLAMTPGDRSLGPVAGQGGRCRSGGVFRLDLGEDVAGGAAGRRDKAGRVERCDIGGGRVRPGHRRPACPRVPAVPWRRCGLTRHPRGVVPGGAERRLVQLGRSDGVCYPGLLRSAHLSPRLPWRVGPDALLGKGSRGRTSESASSIRCAAGAPAGRAAGPERTGNGSGRGTGSCQ